MDLFSVVLNPNAIEAQGDVARLWEQFLQALRLVLVGPIPRALALIAIVIGGLMLYLDSCRHKRKTSVRG